MAFALSSLESPSVSAALIWILGTAGIGMRRYPDAADRSTLPRDANIRIAFTKTEPRRLHFVALYFHTNLNTPRRRQSLASRRTLRFALFARFACSQRGLQSVFGLGARKFLRSKINPNACVGLTCSTDHHRYYSCLTLRLSDEAGLTSGAIFHLR